MMIAVDVVSNRRRQPHFLVARAGQPRNVQVRADQVVEGSCPFASIVDDIVRLSVRRLNKCGVISPRYDLSHNDIEDWVARLLPSRQVRVSSRLHQSGGALLNV